MTKVKNKEIISIQVNPDEKVKIVQGAMECGVSTSEFIRLSLKNDTESYARLLAENSRLKESNNELKVKLHYKSSNIIEPGNILLKTNIAQRQILEQLFEGYEELSFEENLLIALIEKAFSIAGEIYEMNLDRSTNHQAVYMKTVEQITSLAEESGIDEKEMLALFSGIAEYLDVRRVKVERC